MRQSGRSASGPIPQVKVRNLAADLCTPDLRMASLGSGENIDRAAGHPCQGDDGYGGLQQHKHLGASGKRQSVGRAEREARCESNEQIVRVAGNPAVIVWQRAASLGEKEIPRLVGARIVFGSGGSMSQYQTEKIKMFEVPRSRI